MDKDLEHQNRLNQFHQMSQNFDSRRILLTLIDSFVRNETTSVFCEPLSSPLSSHCFVCGSELIDISEYLNILYNVNVLEVVTNMQEGKTSSESSISRDLKNKIGERAKPICSEDLPNTLICEHCFEALMDYVQNIIIVDKEIRHLLLKKTTTELNSID